MTRRLPDIYVPDSSTIEVFARRRCAIGVISKIVKGIRMELVISFGPPETPLHPELTGWGILPASKMVESNNSFREIMRGKHSD